MDDRYFWLKTIIFLFPAFLFLVSCKKDNNSVTAPIDNGPIGGTYSFSTAVTKTYDTIPGNGVVTMNEYTTVGTNLKGTVTITATTITSKGLAYDYTLTGTKKEVNTATGAQTTTDYTPSSDSRGASYTSYNSSYTINRTAGELTIDDAQYLFNPAFLLQPANKKHSYTLNGNTLKVTSVYYNAGTNTRTINEATFIKQ